MVVPKTILLAFPPHCDTALHGPHLGIPQLVAYLQQKGHSVASLDLNIAFFRYVTRPDAIRYTINDLQRHRDILNAKEFLNHEELDELLDLYSIDRFTDRLTKYDPDGQLDDDDFSLAIRLLAPYLYDSPTSFPANPTIVGSFVSLNWIQAAVASGFKPDSYSASSIGLPVRI